MLLSLGTPLVATARLAVSVAHAAGTTGCGGILVSPAPQPLVGGVFVVDELELEPVVLEDPRAVEPALPELAALPDCELVPEVPGDEPLAPLEEPPVPGEDEPPFPEAEEPLPP
jgi:hypothetical protein